jgi:glucose/arabinose dehydrogenase
MNQKPMLQLENHSFSSRIVMRSRVLVRSVLPRLLLCTGLPMACSGSAGPSASKAGASDASQNEDATSGREPSEGGEAGAEASIVSEADGPSFEPDGALSGAVTHPCTLPGSVQWTDSGPQVVPGGSGPDLTWMKLPAGFCSHYFGSVGNARQIRFAPGGELFVASPTGPTTGGGSNGQNAIIVLADDNRDGVAEVQTTFLANLPNTQGLLFVPGYLYYQDTDLSSPIVAKIMRIPYARGQRTAVAATEVAADVSNVAPQDSLHWPKTLDVADDGSIYVGNGGSQSDVCQQAFPFLGGILKLDGNGSATKVAQGFRNPIAIRCSRGHDLCFALELALDYSAGQGGREKMVPIRQGDNWGYPCCASANLPYTGVTYSGTSTPPDCSQIASDTESFLIGDTPFGLDFEPGVWTGTWGGRAFIATHGSAGSWTGARVVGISMDGATGMPVPGSNIADDKDTGGMADFATGWDDGLNDHGRPAAVTFSPDGRLFLANDSSGDIVWIAPMTL